MQILINLIGQKYGSLTIVEDLGMLSGKRGRKVHYCECACDCGRSLTLAVSSVKGGNSKTCGHCNCNGAHRGYGNKIYSCYLDMKYRCYNPTKNNYINYGGRGITVCDEWLHPIDGFENFCRWSFMNGFKNGLSIDRIDNDGNYEPDNCRWATKRIQNINKRPNVPNTSGYVGIRKHSLVGWYGSVKISNKDFYTGWSKDIIEAVKMRNEYIIKNHLDNELNEVS